MKIFVTGGTGFIGKHLVRRLVDEGHEVLCLVRDGKKGAALAAMGVKPVLGDVNTVSSLHEGMRDCDWLFHLANLYSMWEKDRSRFAKVNIDGTRNVLQAALDCGVKKAVYISTVAVYGKPAESPFQEGSAPGPVLFSDYARTKAAAEHIAWDFYRQGLPLVVFYPGIILGAGDEKASGHYIQDIIRRRVPSTIFHNSSATYTYVGDLVDAVLRAAQRQESIGQKYLIGGQTIKGCDYADLISEVSGVPLPIFRLPDWMVLAAAYLLTGISNITGRSPLWGLSIDAGWTLKNGFCIDGSKAERELGIRYTPIRQALSEAIESYREQWARKK